MHVSNTFGGQRVTAQIGVGTTVVVPGGLLQLVKHADKTRSVKACLGHHTKTDAVGLTLHIAREIELGLG